MREPKRFFSYMGKYKVSYWCVFILTLLTSAVLNLAYSYMNKLIFNAMEYGDYELFRQAAVLCIILLVLNCLAPYRRYFQIRIVRKLVFDVKIKLFEKLMKMDMVYYEKNHSGEVLKVLNSDANSLKDSYFSHIFWVFGRLVSGVTAILTMIIYSPLLMIVSVSFCLITVFLSVRINRQIKAMDRGIQTKLSRLTARLSDILSGFAELKMYNGASIVYDNYHEENRKILADEERRADKAAVLEMADFFLGIIASFGTIGAGAYLVARGQMDYGTVMAVVSLQMAVSTMVQSCGSALTTFSASLAKAERVFDFLEMDGEEDQDNSMAELKKGAAPIEVENLTFSYDDQREILKNFSLCLAEGERVMLIGESGCGKSTLLKLLMGFYKAENGTMKLYDRNINEYSLFQLRGLITYIPQRSYLFEGTIRENILAGAVEQEQVSEDQLAYAAKMACADEFICSFPQGYDTLLTAGGSNLSVGQKQRIAIARAFLKNSPILLMDEPASALDVHSEKMIHQAIGKLMKEKVVIMVSHRRDSFEQFDHVVEIPFLDKVQINAL